MNAPDMALCPSCSGSGEGCTERVRCWVCGGSGEVEAAEPEAEALEESADD